jgi:hypothetical protein
MQKSFANHWVMVYERNGNLVILRKWDEKKIRRTRHFCGRAHVSRYVERWIANPSAAVGAVEGAAAFEPQKPGHSVGLAQSVLDAEDGAMAAKLVAKSGLMIAHLKPAASLPIGVSMEGRENS